MVMKRKKKKKKKKKRDHLAEINVPKPSRFEIRADLLLPYILHSYITLLYFTRVLKVTHR